MRTIKVVVIKAEDGLYYSHLVYQTRKNRLHRATYSIDLIHHYLETSENYSQHDRTKGQSFIKIIPNWNQVSGDISPGDNNNVVAFAIGSFIFLRIGSLDGVGFIQVVLLSGCALDKDRRSAFVGGWVGGGFIHFSQYSHTMCGINQDRK